MAHRDAKGRYTHDPVRLRKRRRQIIAHHLDTGTRAGRLLAEELAERWGLALLWVPMERLDGASLSVPPSDPDAGRLLAALEAA